MIRNKESLEIQPFTTLCNAKVQIPGSKSISNRALILSSMCDAEVELIGILESEDVDLMQKALQSLDIKIIKTKKGVKIFGVNGNISKKEATINVGNAGTIARFLTCFLANQKEAIYSLDGTEAMRNRPMVELLDCLIDLGCKIEYKGKYGKFPITLSCNGLKNNNIYIDARKSGQNISGILMQCPAISEECTVHFNKGTVSVPFIEMTLKMMCAFIGKNAFKYEFKGNSIHIKSKYYQNTNLSYQIEPDATAASYFLTLPIVTGGKCNVLGLSNNMIQGDIAYCDIINQIGAEIIFEKNGVSSRANGRLKGGSFNFNDISDTFLTLAAISPLLESTLEIYGIEHTRKQETDRVSAMARELKKLGQDVTEKKDRLIIKPDLNKLIISTKEGVSVDTYNDHRFAMSFAILGSYDLRGNGTPWLTINDPLCCSKTFPGFFDCLNTAYTQSHAKK